MQETLTTFHCNQYIHFVYKFAETKDLHRWEMNPIYKSTLTELHDSRYSKRKQQPSKGVCEISLFHLQNSRYAYNERCTAVHTAYFKVIYIKDVTFCVLAAPSCRF
jgi:hypothetical protein